MNAYGVPPGHRFPFDQKPYRLAPLAAILTGLFTIVAAAVAAATLAGPAWLADEPSQVDDFGIAVALAALIVVVLTMIFFVIWQHRHAKNARLLGHRAGLGPEWAVAGWVIPVGNFVLPGLQLYSASRFSDPAVAAGQQGHGQPIVWLWMLVFDVGWVLAIWTPLGGLVLAAAAVLALVMVRQLSELQEQAIRMMIARLPR